jgi:hypothetical protein
MLMGCGCRKNNGKKRRVKAAAARKVVTDKRLAATKEYRAKRAVRKKLIAEKMKFCKPCPHSKQTSEERRNQTRVCHKASMAIQSILNKANFKCPLGNF